MPTSKNEVRAIKEYNCIWYIEKIIKNEKYIEHA